GVGKPDLVISKIVCDRANDRIGYRVTNVGCDVAAEGHETTLSVDGTWVDMDQVTVDLGPGETFEGWFDDYTWPTCHTVATEVCADRSDIINEADEGNNCRDSGCISAQLEWTWNSTTVEPDYDQVMMAPVAADLDDNGIPDIVFSTFKGSNYVSDGILRAIRGDNGTELFSVTSPNYRVIPGGGVAVADIDDDGKPEILANKDPVGIICFEHDGTYKWMSSTPAGGFGGVAVADLDEDGRPEIVARKTVLRNDGTTWWTGAGGGASGYPIVANLDMAGHPEVVSGDTAYRHDGTIYWRGTHAGNPAVANLDDDAYPEVVIVGGDRISIWEHDGVLKWGPMPVPSTGNGPPVIADMDGAGLPEIGVGGYDYYVAYEPDLSIKWMAEIRDHSSRAASSTAFDFDGDGAFEILYSDELYHRIFRGTDGAVLFEVPGPSGTLLEHPFIVDVDNDDHAEIVAAVNNYAFSGNTGIEVYGNDTCWPDARPIWNQHTYHITNIGDDAQVPTVETNNWAVHNNYRTQSPGIPEERPMLFIEPASAMTSISGTATVEIRIQNVTDLYGVQLHLSFDPSIVQVEDAIPGGDVNIAPGDFLQPGAVVYTNYVNNSTGEIEYVQSRQGAVPGVDGAGLLARITFHGEAAGVSPVEFTLHILSDPMSVPIAHGHADGEIIVRSDAGVVRGKVILERRVNYPNANLGATVMLASQSYTTPDDGTYSFSGVPVGAHEIRVTHPSYLPTWRNVNVTSGGTSVLPDVEMLGGDCSAVQGIIDGVDAVVMGLAWGSTPVDAHWNARADVRDDAVIDVLDLTAVRFNWKQSAPGPWPTALGAARADQQPVGVPPLAPQTPAQTTVVISPTSVTTGVGESATVDIWVQDVEDLYGGGFELDFDPSVVNVQDANTFQDGVQIESGSWLEHQLEVANSADNATGEVDFFVTQSHPATAKDGNGILARITFVGMANGTSTLQFTSVQLVDDQEATITATTQDGEVVVGGYRIYLPLVLRGG
ncbi:MAG: cohesin domain-containing protein, partial [Anaerolineae bacterium]